MHEPNSRSPFASEESPRFLGDALREDASAFRPSGALVVLLVAFAAGFVFWLGAQSASRSSSPPLSGPFVGDKESTQAARLVVHVAGEVQKPGVYELPPDSRVRDAIQRAGGAKPHADVNAINLAAFIEDGAKIEVPAKPKIAPLPAPASTPLPAPEVSAPAYAPALPQLPAPREESTPAPTPAVEIPKLQKPKSPKSKTEKPKVLPNVPRAKTKSGTESQKASPEWLQKHPLNLNTASAEELQLLPGVGPAMAAKILDARKQKGGFKSVDELDEVPGIGPKKLEKLRPLVTVH